MLHAYRVHSMFPPARWWIRRARCRSGPIALCSKEMTCAPTCIATRPASSSDEIGHLPMEQISPAQAAASAADVHDASCLADPKCHDIRVPLHVLRASPLSRSRLGISMPDRGSVQATIKTSPGCIPGKRFARSQHRQRAFEAAKIERSFPPSKRVAKTESRLYHKGYVAAANNPRTGAGLTRCRCALSVSPAGVDPARRR